MRKGRPLEAILHDGAFERPGISIDRQQRIVNGMRALGEGAHLSFARRRAGDEELGRVHDPLYIHGLRELCADGIPMRLDPELVVDELLFDAAAAAAAALTDAAATAHSSGPVRICLNRPGSHHAGRDYALGFCVINNLAVAAAGALASGRCERVAILDFDAHHGNGTEQIFAAEERVLTVSIHQHPFFPGTGDPDSPAKANLNLPLAAGAGDREALDAYRRALERIAAHDPDLILVEAGVDGHIADHTSDLRISDEAYRRFGHELALCAEGVGAGLAIEMGGGYTEASVLGGFGAFLEGLC